MKPTTVLLCPHCLGDDYEVIEEAHKPNLDLIHCNECREQFERQELEEHQALHGQLFPHDFNFPDERDL